MALGSNKTQEKNMFEEVISPVHFGRCLSCYSNFNFFYTDDKETNFKAHSKV